LGEKEFPPRPRFFAAAIFRASKDGMPPKSRYKFFSYLYLNNKIAYMKGTPFFRHSFYSDIVAEFDGAKQIQPVTF